MTQEEKAKRYDEAIEIAKDYVEKQNPPVSALYEIFPELKESEDEKIREKLIEYFKDLMGGWFPYSNEEIIAYLEKLKDFDKQLELQYKRGYDAAMREITYTEREADAKTIRELQERINELTHSPVTKKSDKVEWSDEDQDFFGLLEGYLEFDYELSNNDKANTLDWLKSIKERLQ